MPQSRWLIAGAVVAVVAVALLVATLGRGSPAGVADVSPSPSASSGRDADRDPDADPVDRPPSVVAPTPAPTPTTAPATTPPRASGPPLLAWAEFLARLNEDRSTVEGLNAALTTAAQAQDPDAVKAASVDILDFVDVERDWLRDHPPADCYAAAHGAAAAMLDAYGTAADRFIDWSASGGGLGGLPALGVALDAADTARAAFETLRRGTRGHDMSDLTGDPIPPVRHVTSRRIVAVRGESLEVRDDRVVGEAPLEIRAAGPRQEPVAVAVTMRTPGNEAELAVGFLRTEGLLDGQEVLGTSGGDPGALSQPDDTIVVRLSRTFDDSKVAERHFVATASCGICGKASIDEVALRTEPLPEGPVVSRSVILALPDLLRAAQRAFDETGGLHAAGLFTPKGELLALREDVGRHNAIDKLVGSQVLAGAMPLHDRVLMVSGRVSFEIVQKAAVAGIPIVCAVSAPSDLAIETAERLGVTLVGFLRGDGFNVYAHDARIDLRDLSGLG